MIALYLEGPIFRRSYVQKVLCSENIYLFRRSYVQLVFYSEVPMFEKSYVQKVLYSEDLCSEGLMLEHISIFQFQV